MNIYLFFNGNCEDAMKFYQNAAGGSIESLVRFSDTRMDIAEADKNKIMHGVMLINETKVMFSDAVDGGPVGFGDNFSLSMDFKDNNLMKTTFNRLSKGGRVTMPLQNTFWGAVHGRCTDKFGVNWMFHHYLENQVS